MSENEVAQDTVTQEESAPVVETAEKPQEKVVDYGKVIAGVKKEFRQKGYNEGFEAANEQRPAPQATPVQTPVVESAPVAIDEKALFDKFRHHQWLEKATQVDAAGNQAHSDYSEKLTTAGERANYDPSFRLLMQKAYETGNHDVIYSIMTDDKARQALLDTNPNQWVNKLHSLGKEEAKNVPKNPADPISEIKGTPATGTKNLTFQQKQKRTRDLYG